MSKKDYKYNTTPEWLKDIKFNNHWYHLLSLYDEDQSGNEFDFNAALDKDDEEFDFNNALSGIIYDPEECI